MTRFTYGAINPLTVMEYTDRELSEYVIALRQHNAEVAKQNQS